MRVSLFCVLFAVCSAQISLLPSWNMPPLRPLQYPYGGAQAVHKATYIELFQASTPVGTYNMSPMISFFNGMFIATWKNAPQDEDQPGQRVLYSQSLDGSSWLPSNNGQRVLFHNISTNANPTALFAEPTLLLNSRVYAAASPTQFCLYPDQYQSVLLLRQVFDDVDSFGPIFWASEQVPSGFEENSLIHGLLTLQDMPNQVQLDVELLNQTNPTYRPCNAAREGETQKCEYCENGCQEWTEVFNSVSTIENERTHYLLPNNTGDVILYRNKGELPNHLYASVRSPLDAPWPLPMVTNITDDVANLNAGNLPDGRAFLVSNAMVNAIRDPLYLSITDATNLHFVDTTVISSCHMQVFGSLGCVRRHPGRGKQPGCQYPQSLIQEGAEDMFFAIFSLNKEDIWLASFPLANI